MNENSIKSGRNWYGYVENNPLNFVDPWGLKKAFVTIKNNNQRYEIDLNKQSTFLQAFNLISYYNINSNTIFSFKDNRMISLPYKKNIKFSEILESLGLNYYYESYETCGTYVVNRPEIGSKNYLNMISAIENDPFIADEGFVLGNFVAKRRIMSDMNYTINLNLITDKNFKNLGVKYSELIQSNLNIITSEENYFRNKLNRTPSSKEKLNILLEKNIWYKVEQFNSVLHQLTKNNLHATKNQKYMSQDGMYEAVFDYKNNLVTEYNDPINMGTFNYYGNYEDNFMGKIYHGLYDVIPWILYGTSEKDNSTFHERIKALNISESELDKTIHDISLGSLSSLKKLVKKYDMVR